MICLIACGPTTRVHSLQRLPRTSRAYHTKASYSDDVPPALVSAACTNPTIEAKLVFIVLTFLPRKSRFFQSQVHSFASRLQRKTIEYKCRSPYPPVKSTDTALCEANRYCNGLQFAMVLPKGKLQRLISLLVTSAKGLEEVSVKRNASITK